MSTTAWLGIGFLVLLTATGLAALIATGRDISRSDLDDRSKSMWGLLIGLSPWAGLFAWHRRDDLLGHSEDEPKNQ